MRPTSILRPVPIVLCAALMAGLGSSRAQTVVDPGESVQIGPASSVTDSVSDCGGLNSCGVEYDLSTNTVGAVTALSGVGSKKTARVTLHNRFEVSGDNDRALDAQLSGRVEWEGDLESLGVIGAKGSVTIKVQVVDLENGLTVGGSTVVSEACETFILFDSCLRRIDGSAAVNLPLRVQRGRAYEMRFSLECQSNSGAGDANCVFNQNGAFPLKGGFARRSDFTLTVEPDIVGMLEQLQASVDRLSADLARHDREVQTRIAVHDVEIKAALVEVRADVARNYEGILENMRLLLTPTGRRATDLPACHGQGCAFPDGADAGPGTPGPADPTPVADPPAGGAPVTAPPDGEAPATNGTAGGVAPPSGPPARKRGGVPLD